MKIYYISLGKESNLVLSAISHCSPSSPTQNVVTMQQWVDVQISDHYGYGLDQWERMLLRSIIFREFLPLYSVSQPFAMLYFKINRESRAFKICLVHLIDEIWLFFGEVVFPVSNTALTHVVRQHLVVDPIGSLNPGLTHRGKGRQANDLIKSVFGQWLLEEISDTLDWAAMVLWYRKNTK